FFYSILPDFTHKLPAPEGLLELKFKELLFNIFLDPLNKNVLAYANNLLNTSKTPIWQVVEKNYMFNLTVEQFAQMANRSVSVFKKEFHQYYHTTPGKWLVQKRLELAKSLLEADKKNIGEVAFSSGFENLSHFSRVFKEKYGVAPTKYKGT
ncbi:MAG TPA: AraC family transcriptional regulator, partial [Cytophagales bacterium]|nr:AraC family transcriptional regulator [Cytophagales bacterium]